MSILSSILRLTLHDQVSGRARAINKSIAGITAGNRALLGSMGRIAAFGGAYLGVSAGISSTAGAAIQFESAFADVRKVVDASDEQFENMRRTIRQMSNELPIAATDIAALFAAAGESGVATNDLKAFSEMAARVGIAFDMSAGEAGEALAKLKTQLGLTVPETGDLADAINHLSNNMTSKAKDVTDYMLRVGALAEMGGFAKEQIAAIGSAMIAAGAKSETAGTAMQNVVKKMTAGDFAKKDQREAAKSLGLDLPTIAKRMQKDAPKALKEVLTAISKAPKHNHIALLSKFFGDEAKAFAPLVGNIELLDKALDSVSDTTKYSGSAFREYVARADTTANVLQILKNRFVNLGSSIGDSMLPHIKAAAIEIGAIFDTLGERVTVFDKIGTAIQGFAAGIGSGGLRDIIDDIKELFFGEVDGADAADQMGRIFAKFREWGSSVRELSAAIAANPLVKFFADLAPYGFQIMLWGVGLTMLAGTIRKLASALLFLSGVSTILGAIKAVGAIADIAGGGKPGAPKGKPGGSPKGGVVPSNFALMLAAITAAGGYEFGSQVKSGDTLYKQGKAIIPGPEDAAHGIYSAITSAFEKFFVDKGPSQFSSGSYLDELKSTIPSLHGAPAAALGGTREPITAESIRQAMAPQGTQDVRVTNQQPPEVKMSNVFNIYESVSGQATAGAVAAQLGGATRSAVESSYSDGPQ